MSTLSLQKIKNIINKYRESIILKIISSKVRIFALLNRENLNYLINLILRGNGENSFIIEKPCIKINFMKINETQ